MPLRNLEDVMFNFCVRNASEGTLSFPFTEQGAFSKNTGFGGYSENFSEDPPLPSNDAPQYPCLTTLSAYHSRLTSLEIKLYISDLGISNYLAPSIQLFNNTFPYLQHFIFHSSSCGVPLASFFQRHPDLRSFSFFDPFPAVENFSSNILPSVTRLAGNSTLLAAICDAWKDARANVLTLWGVYGSGPEDYTKSILPKLPGLIELRVEGGHPISPDWLSAIGKACPKLTYLDIGCTYWGGHKVRLQ